MVFRLTTGVSGDSANDTRLEEEPWSVSSECGTRMGARSTGTELLRTLVGVGVDPVQDDADFR